MASDWNWNWNLHAQVVSTKKWTKIPLGTQAHENLCYWFTPWLYLFDNYGDVEIVEDRKKLEKKFLGKKGKYFMVIYIKFLYISI